MRLAVMQPYFCPYAGYFRLLSATDLFVVYDDVQYPKGGWVSRNRFLRTDGQLDWLNLPIKRQPLGSLIHDMEWQPSADEAWKTESRRFAAFNRDEYPDNFLSFFVYYLQPADGRMSHMRRSPLDFIVESIKATCYDLNIRKNIVLSSSLPIPEGLKGQERVLWICEYFRASEYVNAPRGRELYDEGEFKRRGITLKILSEYPNKESILDRLQKENPDDIRKEIDALS